MHHFAWNISSLPKSLFHMLQNNFISAKKQACAFKHKEMYNCSHLQNELPNVNISSPLFQRLSELSNPKGKNDPHHIYLLRYHTVCKDNVIRKVRPPL